MSDQSLEQEISAAIKMGFIPKEVSTHIKENLNPKFELRPYQIEAFTRFDYLINQYPHREKPTQLLFHMATGSGKTLIMAGVILALYEIGYRNFIFFVPSGNIIEKTKDNFLNTTSAKYLFNEVISIGDKRIEIKEVDNFSGANQANINIVFTTIQGLHSDLNTPKENSVTYTDFEDKKIVLLSDEAHHINAATKKGKQSKDALENSKSWEETVRKLFLSNSNNLLLEFTATADLKSPVIEKKYSNKLLFDYPLRDFWMDRYSKEVQILQADLSPIDRALQAIILSQYRKKIFEKNGIRIKPVILFKSKKISESADFLALFLQTIHKLKPVRINKIRSQNNSKLFELIFDYFDKNNISIPNLITELKADFSTEKCISIDSKDDSFEKQLVVNSLEDDNNEYRAIFAVDKLNEGWDVLNLFDIVRLYNTRDSDHKQGKIGKTTMTEAQLIGRGARYCPFVVSKDQSLYRRKYDDNPSHELRICEELYYHSAHNPSYITELNRALIEIGLKTNNKVKINLVLKDKFKNSEFYKHGVIYLNKRITYDRSKGSFIDNGLNKTIINKAYKHKLVTGHTSINKAFGNTLQLNILKANQIHRISQFEVAIVRKAIRVIPFYRFDNLLKYFPNLESISEFISSDLYLGKIKVDVEGTIEQVAKLNNQEKLDVLYNTLSTIAQLIPKSAIYYKGSTTFYPSHISTVFNDKTLNISLNNGEQELGIGQSKTQNNDLFIDLSEEDWYVYNDNFGTAVEKQFVKYIKRIYPMMIKKYDEVYLIRNENHFKLYTFDKGQAFLPDYVLILVKNNKNSREIKQIFIESKGGDKISNDDSRIKDNFLQKLNSIVNLEIGTYDIPYDIHGLPLYNPSHDIDLFEEKFMAIVQK